ncbi:MAG TPA: hypothetical protein VMB47_17845 [Candidatus Aquilonibacter sp.]|nr:hypothetical protein [Candidatus Aquilonibacter sp.]
MSRTSLCTLGFFALVYFAIWLVSNVWNAPVGLAWHIAHGRYVTLNNGRKFAVPWDMWVERSDADGITIMRDAPDDDFLHSRSGVMLIKTASPPIDFDKDLGWLSSMNERQPKGFDVSERAIAGGTARVYCWEVKAPYSSDISISCWLDKSPISAFFTGSPAYRGEFYAIVSAASGSNGR